MDEAVKDYIDAIPAEHRALFDWLHRLILRAHPGASEHGDHPAAARGRGRHLR